MCNVVVAVVVAVQDVTLPIRRRPQAGEVGSLAGLKKALLRAFYARKTPAKMANLPTLLDFRPEPRTQNLLQQIRLRHS